MSWIGVVMTRVVFVDRSKTPTGSVKKTAQTAVTEKRVHSAGKISTIRTLDGGSKTFGNDLTYVFTRNVAKARRENKLVTGATDRAPAKS
jgi:hypothetical protein